MPSGTLDSNTATIGPITMSGPKTFNFKGPFGPKTVIRLWSAPTGTTTWRPIDKHEVWIKNPQVVTLDLHDVDILIGIEHHVEDITVEYT